MSCPDCQEAARFKGYRPKALVCAMGPLTVERAYYHCVHCHQGHCPGDVVFGLGEGDLTPGAAEITSLAGALESFAHAAEVILPRMSGLKLAESTVERTTEAIGRELGESMEAGVTFGEPHPWAWHRDGEGAACAYVSIDSTGVGKQGPNGAAAEGEMATVGMIYNPVPEDPKRWGKPTTKKPAWQTRYVATLEGQAAVGGPLQRQAARVGIGDADRWIALSDGGAGLEDLLRAHFGRLDAVILDFYHASEYLGDLAKSWCAGDAEGATAQHQKWAHQLKHEGGAAMLEQLEALDISRRPQARRTWETTVTYFRNQQHRMDYPTYVAKGWQIGSGPVEAACKTVIGERMKGSGMRWGHEGADAVAHLRALLLSEKGEWGDFWEHRQAA